MKIYNEVLICEDYSVLKSIIKVAKKHKSYPDRISKILKKNKIYIPTTAQIASIFSSQKMKIDESYFETIDTEEKAYFLGFLAADGSNFTPKNKISITLNSKDKEILKKFKIALKADKLITDKYQESGIKKTFNWYSTFTISNLKLSQDLLFHGICDRKSYYLKFPTTVPKDLIKHYIRGHFDGDGSIGYRMLPRIRTKSGVPIALIAIISTIDFIQSLVNFIYIETNIKMGIKYHPNKTHSYATLGGSLNIIQFMEWLYKDSTIYLQRKYKKYQEFKLIYQEYKYKLLFNRKIIQCSKEGAYITTFNSKEEASKILKLNMLGIYNNCTGRTKTSGKFVFCFEKNYKKI